MCGFVTLIQAFLSLELKNETSFYFCATAVIFLQISKYSPGAITVFRMLIIFPYSIILAAVGLIESLMTLNLVDDLTAESPGADTEDFDGQQIGPEGFLDLLFCLVKWEELEIGQIDQV